MSDINRIAWYSRRKDRDFDLEDEMPSEIVIMDEIPYKTSGKVDYLKLKAVYMSKNSRTA